MKTGHHRRLGLAIIAAAALTPCCSWIGANNNPPHTLLVGPPGPPAKLPTPEIKPPAPQPKPEPPAGPEHTSVPTAKPVPGKDGFVFSPFNNKLIDVKEFKSGALVSDPRFQLSERKFFRVP